MARKRTDRPSKAGLQEPATAPLTGKPHAGLSRWVEATVCLPEGNSAEPGPFRLWPYQRAVADAIGDPTLERVTIVKPVRVGFTSLLTAAIAHFVVREPAPILCLLPTESDCRNYVVSEIEPMFDASPALQGHLPTPTTAGRDSRSTLLHRIFAGGSLKIVPGKAPRNLRSHTARILFIDEADAIEVSAEGNPITLAEKRTLSFSNRKIVVGSTPLDEATSHVLRCYSESDQRIYEVPCPDCGTFSEILWPQIEWPTDHPERAAWRCPHCAALIHESNKPAMVRAGQWRATRPDIEGHAGFRLNALVSLLHNASWAKLAAEYLRAKDDSETLKVFINTILGQGWKETADEIDIDALAARAESFSLDNIPREVLALTAGVDVQDDRLECSIVGHASNGDAYVLAHQIVFGSALDSETWAELDDLLKTRWRNGALRIDACVIDGGDGGHYDTVQGFCNPRSARKMLCGKGLAGFSRPMIAMSRTNKGIRRIFLVGVDSIKSQIVARLSQGRTIRFSNTLEPEYFEQLCSERRVVRLARGKPTARFERKVGARAEALDALVYSLAAKAAVSINFGERFDAAARIEKGTAPPPKPAPSVIRSQWMSR